jgi:hypothetical protein
MRVELRIAQPPSPPEAAPKPISPAAAVSKPEPRVQAPRTLDVLCGWKVTLPVFLAGLAVLLWTAVWRMPRAEGLVVSAREQVAPANERHAPVSEAGLSALRTRSEEARTSLLRRREDIAPLVARLETTARQNQLWMEFSIKPPVAAPAGFTELAAHNVSIRLVDDFAQDGAAHRRFLAWLREAVSHGRQTEITSLRLRSNGTGVSEALVELQLFTAQSHEEPAAK